MHASATNFHSLAQRGDLSIRAWGWNDDGQCNIPADIGKVKRIAAGTNHTIAIRDFGTPFTNSDAAADDCP